MKTKEFADLIADALLNNKKIADKLERILTFAGKGLFTSDTGLVVEIGNETFYLTIEKR